MISGRVFSLESSTCLLPRMNITHISLHSGKQSKFRLHSPQLRLEVSQGYIFLCATASAANWTSIPRPQPQHELSSDTLQLVRWSRELESFGSRGLLFSHGSSLQSTSNDREVFIEPGFSE